MSPMKTDSHTRPARAVPWLEPLESRTVLSALGPLPSLLPPVPAEAPPDAGAVPAPIERLEQQTPPALALAQAPGHKSSHEATGADDSLREAKGADVRPADAGNHHGVPPGDLHPDVGSPHGHRAGDEDGGGHEGKDRRRLAPDDEDTSEPARLPRGKGRLSETTGADEQETQHAARRVTTDVETAGDSFSGKGKLAAPGGDAGTAEAGGLSLAGGHALGLAARPEAGGNARPSGADAPDPPEVSAPATPAVVTAQDAGAEAAQAAVPAGLTPVSAAPAPARAQGSGHGDVVPHEDERVALSLAVAAPPRAAVPDPGGTTRPAAPPAGAATAAPAAQPVLPSS